MKLYQNNLDRGRKNVMLFVESVGNPPAVLEGFSLRRGGFAGKFFGIFREALDRRGIFSLRRVFPAVEKTEICYGAVQLAGSGTA